MQSVMLIEYCCCCSLFDLYGNNYCMFTGHLCDGRKFFDLVRSHTGAYQEKGVSEYMHTYNVMTRAGYSCLQYSLWTKLNFNNHRWTSPWPPPPPPPGHAVCVCGHRVKKKKKCGNAIMRKQCNCDIHIGTA